MFSYAKCIEVYLLSFYVKDPCFHIKNVLWCICLHYPLSCFILRQGSMFSYEKCTVVYLLTLPSVANACSCVLTLCPVSFYVKGSMFSYAKCIEVYLLSFYVKDRCFHMKNVLWCIYVKVLMFSYAKCIEVYLLSFYVKDPCFHIKNVLWCICLHYLLLLMLVHVC
jgi:hypothetical protein